MAVLLKGADVVSALNERMTKDVESLKSRGIPPTLAILRMGGKPDDISYEKGAVKRCETVGLSVRSIVLPQEATQDAVLQSITSLNNDPGVHGILILRPLPKHIDENEVCKALKPEKDVDGITGTSLSGVFTGSGGFAPCTAQACMEILDHYGVDCAGKSAVVIGRSLVVGKPAAMMLIGKNATVTVCHTKTVDLPSIARSAGILIVAAGKMESLTKEYFSPGQVVIDVGINWNEEKGKLCGDVLFDDAEPIVGAITPVPGGVGTVTTSVLVSHVIEAANKLI